MENLTENKGLLDEGKDYYAPQSFEVEGERISAGWNCHRLGQHIAQPGSANGSLSLPRKLAVKNGKLYSQVIPQIQELFTEKAEKGPYFLSMKKDKRNKGKYSSFSGWITGRKAKFVYW